MRESWPRNPAVIQDREPLEVSAREQCDQRTAQEFIWLPGSVKVATAIVQV
jgi:hypothetical protein